jgi:hypothetical protein
VCKRTRRQARDNRKGGSPAAKGGAEIEGAVIPGIAIKSFALHEAEAAEAWLAAG